MLAASRVLVALTAQSMAAVEDTADVPQLRALVVMATRGPVLSRRLADAGLHLVQRDPALRPAGRRGPARPADNPTDRRHLLLTSPPAGHAWCARSGASPGGDQEDPARG